MLRATLQKIVLTMLIFSGNSYARNHHHEHGQDNNQAPHYQTAPLIIANKTQDVFSIVQAGTTSPELATIPANNNFQITVPITNGQYQFYNTTIRKLLPQSFTLQQLSNITIVIADIKITNNCADEISIIPSGNSNLSLGTIAENIWSTVQIAAPSQTAYQFTIAKKGLTSVQSITLEQLGTNFSVEDGLFGLVAITLDNNTENAIALVTAGPQNSILGEVDAKKTATLHSKPVAGALYQFYNKKYSAYSAASYPLEQLINTTTSIASNAFTIVFTVKNKTKKKITLIKAGDASTEPLATIKKKKTVKLQLDPKTMLQFLKNGKLSKNTFVLGDLSNATITVKSGMFS